MDKSYPLIFRIPRHNLSVYGWSRAAHNTGFYIPELRLHLDAQAKGDFDPQFILITHGHFDHCFSLPRRLSSISTQPSVYVPAKSQQRFEDFLQSAFALDEGEEHVSNYKLVGLRPGDTAPLKNGFHLKTFDLEHRVPCLGYGICRTVTKLRPEFADIAGCQIAALRKQGVAVAEEKCEPVLAYLTDTTPAVFARYPELLTYPLVMTECTYLPLDVACLEKEERLAREGGHTHWTALLGFAHQHDVNFVIVFDR